MVTMIRGLGAYCADGVVAELEHPVESSNAAREVATMTKAAASAPGGFTWLGVVEPTADELAILADAFDIPTLVLEDAANPRQRAKVERLQHDVGFVLLKQLDYRPESSDVETGQIAVITGPTFAITVRHGQVSDLGNIRDRIAASDDLRALGPLGVLYAVMDAVVDGYIAVSDEVIVDVEEIEAEVFSEFRDGELVSRLYRLKRENIEVRRAVQPLTGFAHDAVQGLGAPLPDLARPYFRDIADHLLRVHDQVESADALLTGLVMAVTAQQDLQQNRDMRKISAWVAIAAVPTMIAGIYGMNFEHMPELSSPVGYPIVLGVMAGACGLMYRAFKRSGWL